jgi:hypothetical protein
MNEIELVLALSLWGKIMKYASYALVIVICLLSSTSWSKNPMIRNCNIAGGEFVVVEVTDKLNGYDQWALCKFDQAFVGALDVMFFNDKTAKPISFSQYTSNVQSCNGHVLYARVLVSHEHVVLCQYEDSSVIEMNTLEGGTTASGNQVLNKYLGL